MSEQQAAAASAGAAKDPDQDPSSALSPSAPQPPSLPRGAEANVSGAAGSAASPTAPPAGGEWQQPLVSVDVVALHWSGNPGARYTGPGTLRYAVGRRQFEPFAGEFALPGVLLLPGEFIEAAAARAVATKLHLSPGHITATRQLGAFDGTNRDPRGATISIAILAVIRDPGERPDVEWRALGESAQPLPFDHELIVRAATEELPRRLWQDWGLTRAFFPDETTTSDMLALSDQIGHLPSKRQNMKRFLSESGHLEAVGERGRDTVWRWVAAR